MNKIFNLPYFGSIYHWAQLLTNGTNIIEAHGNYLRRTFRNRVTIMSANGPISLTIPVYSNNDAPYIKTQINYSTDWVSEHINAFRSAYNASPFYEYYEDDLIAIYNKKHNSLWQLNIDLMQLIMQLLQVNFEYTFSETFEKNPTNTIDFRNAIGHNNLDILTKNISKIPYYQVFANKYGFINGLSILDLIFNMGPEAKLILQQMIKPCINTK